MTTISIEEAGITIDMIIPQEIDQACRILLEKTLLSAIGDYFAVRNSPILFELFLQINNKALQEKIKILQPLRNK